MCCIFRHRNALGLNRPNVDGEHRGEIGNFWLHHRAHQCSHPLRTLEWNQGIETRLNAYGPLYVKKPPKYWSNLGEGFIKAQNATT